MHTGRLKLHDTLPHADQLRRELGAHHSEPPERQIIVQNKDKIKAARKCDGPHRRTAWASLHSTASPREAGHQDAASATCWHSTKRAGPGPLAYRDRYIVPDLHIASHSVGPGTRDEHFARLKFLPSASSSPSAPAARPRRSAQEFSQQPLSGLPSTAPSPCDTGSANPSAHISSRERRPRASRCYRARCSMTAGISPRSTTASRTIPCSDASVVRGGCRGPKGAGASWLGLLQ
jgi:hypothetical protein